MKKIFAVMLVVLALLFGAVAVSASGFSLTDFEPAGFVPGESVHNLQPDGTEASPPIAFGNNCVQAWFVPRIDTDEEVVDVSTLFPSHGKVWRFSNGVNDGTLGQAPHSANSGEIHGETGAYNDAGCGPVTTSNYYAEFQFRSATGDSQVGYRISANANSGDTRHAYTRIKDDGAGFDIEFVDTVNGCDYNYATLDLNLSYTDWHTVGIEVFFEDGLASGIAGSAGAEGNDQVNIYVDNQLVHSGTTWESCVGPRSVDRILFDHPETNASFLGGGLYIDNALVTDLCPAGNCLSDSEGPVTTDVVAIPNPAAVGSSVTVTASVDDSTTGGSDIASAEYSLDRIDWHPMNAVTAPFDAVVEDVTASFTAPVIPGIYDLCVRGTDAASNTGETECIMFVVYDPSGGFVTGGGWINSPAEQTKIAFNTIPDPLAGNYPSQPYQAQQTAEFGDHIQFAGTARDLSSVTVTMSSWAKHSDYPLMPMEGFVHPLTLNIYNVDKSGTTPALGTLIKSVTQDFVMQWRPEADPTCPGGTAWRAGDGTCYNGFAFNIVFDLSSDGITLPDEIIYGIASNTQTWGYAPIGVPGPYNSLNFALNNISGPTTGTDVEPDAVFWNTKTASWYSDGGAGGTGTFRRDTGWTGYVPAIRFSVTSPGAYQFDPTLGGKATFGFVSKYKKGASVPEGNTQFQFQAGDLNFSSTSYEWLVVTGSNYAKFKGAGTINGTGNYGFMLWAGDGSPDTFRIKIWDAETEVVVYDNGMDQEIGGGSIVVHKAK